MTNPATLLTPLPKLRFVDANGNALSGGKLFTYAAGTTTKQNTYTDSTGGTANANPIILDTRGECNCWMDNTLNYKFTLSPSTDTDPPTNPIWTVDQVNNFLDLGNVITLTGVSGTDTITASGSNTYKTGQILTFTSAGTNAGTSVTLNPGSGVKSVTKNGSTALAVGDMPPVGGAVQVYCDGTGFQLLTISSANIGSGITILPSLVSTPFVQDVNDFRLTLTTGLPVTTADVTGAATIYCTPYKGKSIALYDGSTRWNVRQSAEFSLALGTLTSGKPYDVFCFDNSGVPTLELLAWTNDTTRATALVYQDGILVKSGATTRRYLGTFYTTATTTTEDSKAKRFLWNYYNRVARQMSVIDATASWTYTTATWRQARASTANQLDMVRGADEDAVFAQVNGSASNSSGTVAFAVSIGLDSTTTPTATSVWTGSSGTAGGVNSCVATYTGTPGLGRHFIAWLEQSNASGTTTWIGTSGTPANGQSGIMGEVMA